MFLLLVGEVGRRRDNLCPATPKIEFVHLYNSSSESSESLISIRSRSESLPFMLCALTKPPYLRDIQKLSSLTVPSSLSSSNLMPPVARRHAIDSADESFPRGAPGATSAHPHLDVRVLGGYSLGRPTWSLRLLPACFPKLNLKLGSFLSCSRL